VQTLDLRIGLPPRNDSMLRIFFSTPAEANARLRQSRALFSSVLPTLCQGPRIKHAVLQSVITGQRFIFCYRSEVLPWQPILTAAFRLLRSTPVQQLYERLEEVQVARWNRRTGRLPENAEFRVRGAPWPVPTWAEILPQAGSIVLPGKQDGLFAIKPFRLPRILPGTGLRGRVAASLAQVQAFLSCPCFQRNSA